MTFVYQLVNVTYKLNPNAQRFFTDIEQQKFKGITSSFVKTEFLSVMKRLLAEQEKKLPDKSSIEFVWKKFNQFLNEMGIEEFDADDLANQDGRIFVDSQRLVEDSTIVQGKDGKWRTLNGADSLHVLLAERSNADKLMTNDEGFRTSKSAVQVIFLKDEYP